MTGQAELQRVRKELIQSKAALSDLQEELEEKNRLYLDAVKVSANKGFLEICAKNCYLNLILFRQGMSTKTDLTTLKIISIVFKTLFSKK